MSEGDAPTPVTVRAPEGARRMEIDWSDGVTTAYSHAVLRGLCPCAHCQGHHGPVQWVEGAEAGDLSLTLIEEVGHYALRLGWGDGHDTGIYSFRYLRGLGEVGEARPDDLVGRTFRR